MAKLSSRQTYEGWGGNGSSDIQAEGAAGIGAAVAVTSIVGATVVAVAFIATAPASVPAAATGAAVVSIVRFAAGFALLL